MDVQDQLGLIEQLTRDGRWQESLEACRELLRIAPDNVLAWFHLGTAALLAQRPPDAEAAFLRAVQLDPTKDGLWNNLSIALRQQRRFAEAESCALQAISLNSANPDHWISLASAHMGQHQWETAAEAYRQATALDPTRSSAWWGLGVAEEARDRLDAARQAYLACLAIAPEHADAQRNLASVLKRQWRLSESELLARQMLAADPDSAEGWATLGQAYLARCRQEDAVAAMRRSVTLTPDPERHSALLLAMQYGRHVTPESLREAHRQWDAWYAASRAPAAPAPPRSRSSGDKLRLGFVSPDFVLHPAAFLVLPALAALDKRRCELWCYSNQTNDDAGTSGFQRLAEAWRQTTGMPPEQIAEQIRADRIDILFDLSGHAGNRLLVFAHRPAPLQISWFGYVGTTGLSAMDGLLADRYHVRPGEEPHYGETVLRMPDGYACYRAPDYCPEVGPLPAARRSEFTFGCFNNPAKFAPPVLAAWAEILARVPRSRLLLKYGGLDEDAVQQHILAHFAERGIEPQRVAFEGWSLHREQLETYRRIDLALDTQPYSGGLTTCEALWMGVPVVTLPGRTFAGRHSVSHLTNAGFAEFAAADWAGYVDLAVAWAERRDELAAVRASLRERMRRSPLCDAPRFAEHFLEVLARAWDDLVTPRGDETP